MRDGLVVEQDVAARIAPGGKTQRAIRLAQENVAAFSTGEAQRSVNQRNQNFVENGQQPAGNFYQGGQPDSPKSQQYGFRLDVNASPKDRFFFRTSGITFLEYVNARQDDSKHFRLWEVAGTAHEDTYLLATGAKDLGTSPDVVAPLITTSPLPGFIMCGTPINSGPQHFVVSAAVAALNRRLIAATPPGLGRGFCRATGGVAALNRRLISGIPPGCNAKA